ncbi:hypothetical protein A5886_001515 [Enterococcus sp. 8G7_MSG3316]|uniref:Uncharacterized protein n=2 Tax=Candidatus Enterococcus testudinis TaxID=1834191 RepID=A0A242A5X5_9ENTE|nr:hypothetical protein A5886_001515 [Enterococcus sp. 8G7_MSG3316]
MQINDLIDRYQQQAEKLEIKLKRLVAKEIKSANDQQRLGIIQGQLMNIDTVIDDLLALEPQMNQTNFGLIIQTLKRRTLNNNQPN